MRAPLGVLALSFACGIGWAWWAAPPAWALAALAGAAARLGWRGRGSAARANLCLLALVILAGMARAAVDARAPADSVERLLGPDARPVTCEGTFAQDDSWYPPRGGRGQRKGWLEIRWVRQGEAWTPASGRVQLRLPARAGPVRLGDRLRVHGLIRAPRAPAVPGTAYQVGTRYRGFNERRWLWGQGACGVLSAADPGSLTVLAGRPTLRALYSRRVADLRWRLQEVGRSRLPPSEAGFLEAFLLGEGRGIPPDVKESFRRTGTIHILVVSGFQVGLIGAIALVALSLLRVPRGPRYLLTGLALFLYCALTGAAPPILRATVMGLALCLGQHQGRETSPLNLLGAAALVILAFDPRALADVGFQLSFAAVLGILLATQSASTRLVPATEGWLGTWYRGAGQAVAASVGAWAAVTPLVAWHLRTVSLIAPAANLLAVPLGSALVADGLLLYAVGLFWPAGAEPFAAGFGLLARAAAELAARAAALPGGSFRW